MIVLAQKKICFILPTFAAGGAERVLITLMNGLNRGRYRPVLICLCPEGPLRSLVAADTRILTPKKPTKVLHALTFLIRTWRSEKPDIVVSTLAHMNFGVLLTKMFLPRGTKVFVREAITPSYMDGMTRHPALIKLFYRLLYPLADMIISPAQIIIDQFRAGVKPRTDRFTLLYNPVDIVKITRALPTPTPPAGPVRFVCAGRLHPQKGFDLLIDALARATLPFDWRVDIWGEGAEENSLRTQIAARNLSARVFINGFTDNPWAEMAKADAFLLPSRYEGLPNVALESLFVGTPVIAMHSAGGIQEISTLSAPDAVTVCSDMDEFVHVMSHISRGKGPRTPLLPATFYPDAVMRRFEEILSSGNTNHTSVPARPRAA